MRAAQLARVCWVMLTLTESLVFGFWIRKTWQTLTVSFPSKELKQQNFPLASLHLAVPIYRHPHIHNQTILENHDRAEPIAHPMCARGSEPFKSNSKELLRSQQSVVIEQASATAFPIFDGSANMDLMGADDSSFGRYSCLCLSLCMCTRVRGVRAVHAWCLQKPAANY